MSMWHLAHWDTQYADQFAVAGLARQAVQNLARKTICIGDYSGIEGPKESIRCFLSPISHKRGLAAGANAYI